MWLSSSSMGDQPLGFAALQPFRVYPCQASMPAGDGLWLMPGVHWEAAPPIALRRGEPHAIHSAVPQPFQVFGEASSFGAVTVTQSLCHPYILGGVFFSRLTVDSKICGGDWTW